MEFCTQTVASDKVMKIGLVKLLAMTFMLLLYAFDYFGNKVIMSPVVNAFRRFTGDQGDFKKELVNDVHEILSLYEAAQFRVHGEEILDEALTFTITQLKLILSKLSNSQLAQQISNALKFSIKDVVVRVETRKCISFYQENHESSNQVLLNFAKLDFNIVQRLHKKELSDLTSYVCPIRRQRNIEAKQVEPTQKEQPPRQRNYPKRDKRRKTIQNQCAQYLDELMTISLQAFTGVNGYQTIRLTSYHEKRPLHVLIDMGCTCNFIYQEMAKKLGC
ncbi:hypothetical protein BC332_24338 [Capsicum chinense]|nr:hypothetical protein BC332_24338 [Capsicum chinense]